MSKSIKALLAAAVVGLFAWGCEKYDDTALNKKIDGLDTRVTALEKAVQDLNNTTIPGLKSLIEALQKQVSISSVTPTADGYVISFSDGTKATLTNGKDGKDGANGKDGQDGKDGVNGADGKDGKDGANGTDGKDGKDGADGQTPVIGVKLVDGVYCWTVNGELLLDANQQPIPVTGANGKDGKDGKDGADGKDGKDGADAVAPQFRITDGVWEVSVDGGTTWAAVPVTGSVPEYVIITETEVAYVFTFADESTIVIPKEQVFCLVITPQQETTDIYSGETLKFDYVVKGASAEDNLLVDILNIVPDYGSFQDSKVIPDKEDTTKGVIEITSQNPWTDGVQYKIFIHAANGKGKTDTKVIVLTAKAFDAVFDVALEAAAGGEYAFEVKSTSPFNVVTDVDWIVANETKAAYEWHGSITIAANETNVYRDGYVRVIDDWENVLKEFYVLQEPAGDKATSISYIKYNIEDGTEGVKANHLTVIAAGKTTAVVTDGLNMNSTNSYLILKNVDKALEVGKVYDFVGTKGVIADWANEGILTDVTATLVEDLPEGVEPVKFDFMSRYYYSTVSKFCTTIIYGTISKDEGVYSIDSGFRNLNYIIDDAAEALKLDELVDKIVYLKVIRMGYELAYDEEKEMNVYTSHVLPLEAEEITFSKETSLTYDFDEYYRAKITIPENIYAAYWPMDTKDVTEDMYKEEIKGYARYILNNISASQSAKDLIELWAANGWYDIWTNQTHTIWLDAMGWDDDKTMFAIEFGEDGLPHGKYLQKDFVRKPVPYAEYLGAWSVWGNYNLTITEKEAGKTFNIKGINNQIRSPYNPSGDVILIEATYNETTGQMSVASQEIAPAYELNYNTLVDILAGDYTGYENVGENLFNGDVKKDEADKYYLFVSPAQEGIYGLTYKTYAQWGQWGSFGNASTYVDSPWYYKVVEEDPSEKYQAWLGNWRIGDKIYTISQNVANQSYKFGSFGDDTEINAIVDFEPETGTILFNHAKTGATVSKDGRYYEYYSVGQDENENFVYGEGNQVAVLALQEDGSAKIAPAMVSTWVNYYEANGYEWPNADNWSITGDFWGYNWSDDYILWTNGEWDVAPSVWFNTGEMFKFRKDANWSINYGGNMSAIGEEFDLVAGGPDIVIPAYGNYDILFNPVTLKAKVIPAQPNIENKYKVQATKIGVAPYNAGAGWIKEKAVMIDITATLNPVQPNSIISKRKAARAAKHERQHFVSKHVVFDEVRLVVED